MNAQDAVNWGRRLLEDISSNAADGLDVKGTDPGTLWKNSYPRLNNGLRLYDKIAFSALPDPNWIDKCLPMRETKASCQAELDKILDQLLAVLGACSAGAIRAQISNLEAEIDSARTRIGENERRRLSAPQRESQGIIDGFLSTSREAVEEEIATDQDRIDRAKQQIADLKAGFSEHLKSIGVCVSAEESDTYLLPVEDDLVPMAAVIANVGRLTEQLQELVDRSREAPQETLRYYGAYVLLVLAVDRIEKHFLARIDEELLPKLGRFEWEARQHIAEAGAQIGHGGPVEQLSAAIKANEITVSGSRMFAEVLKDQRRSISDRNNSTQTMLNAAVVMYRTARTGVELATLIGRCQTDFQALRELRLPPLRAFQNTQLTDELKRLAARVAKKE